MSPASPAAALDPQQQVLADLEELLEAERAGARVTMPAVTDPGNDTGRALIAQVHRDEVHWCGVLMTAIRRLGGAPGSRTGAFHEKVLAIDDLNARLQLLNRGQAWVMRRIESLLPRIDDPAIRADLEAMDAAHRVNIDQTDAWLAQQS